MSPDLPGSDNDGNFFIKSIPLCVRYIEQCMSYKPAQPVLLSYFLSNKE